MEKGRGVSMKKWALLSLQHIPRQEETAPLQAELSGARGVEERCFAILFLFSRLKSQMLGSPSGFSVPCSQGMLGWRRKGSAMPPWSRERGGFTQGKVMGMENGDVEQQGRL